jgi:hypothetical protein
MASWCCCAGCAGFEPQATIALPTQPAPGSRPFKARHIHASQGAAPNNKRIDEHRCFQPHPLVVLPISGVLQLQQLLPWDSPVLPQGAMQAMKTIRNSFWCGASIYPKQEWHSRGHRAAAAYWNPAGLQSLRRSVAVHLRDTALRLCHASLLCVMNTS